MTGPTDAQVADGPYRLPVRAELDGLEPYGAPQLDVPVLLNVNENPYAAPAEVVDDVAAAVRAVAGTLNRYPDRDFVALRTDLAAYLTRDTGVTLVPEQLWAANGSNEVMLHLLQAFGGPGRTALSFTPTYSMYPEYARDTNTGYATAARAGDLTLDVPAAEAAIAERRPSVVFVASPNNPSGTATRLAELDRLATATEAVGGVLVVDEAYGEFRRAGVPSAVELLADHPGVAVSRTMSKAFALAGGRVGYLAAAPGLIDVLRVVRLPYHLSAVTQAVARTALRHADVLLGRVAQLRDDRDALVTQLRGRGLQAPDSDANFVLFGRFADRHAVWQALLDRGVLIRETGPEGWLRVSVGTPGENTAFLTALDETLMADGGSATPEEVAAR